MSIGDNALDLFACQPEQLATYAHKAFLLGMLDGMQRASPRSSLDLMTDLLPAGAQYRVYHRKKFRQVYGAGFDISRMHVYIATHRELAGPAQPALTNG